MSRAPCRVKADDRITSRLVRHETSPADFAATQAYSYEPSRGNLRS